MVKRKILIGVSVVLGTAVTIFNPLASGLCALCVWIYLVTMVRKQSKSVFSDRMEQEMAERHLKRLKALLITAGFSFFLFVVGSIVHNVLHGLYEIEEAVSLLVAIVALVVFIVATAGGMLVFLKARKAGSQSGHIGA